MEKPTGGRPVSAGSGHDHGNCELCDRLSREAEGARLDCGRLQEHTWGIEADAYVLAAHVASLTRELATLRAERDTAVKLAHDRATHIEQLARCVLYEQGQKEQAEAALQRARAALEKYGTHMWGCSKIRPLWRGDVPQGCTCGLDAARAEA